MSAVFRNLDLPKMLSSVNGLKSEMGTFLLVFYVLFLYSIILTLNDPWEKAFENIVGNGEMFVTSIISFSLNVLKD